MLLWQNVILFVITRFRIDLVPTFRKPPLPASNEAIFSSYHWHIGMGCWGNNIGINNYLAPLVMLL